MRMILAVLAIWVTMAGLAMAQPSRVFNVSTYGAKPDDGVADTTGIQKAIDAAAAEAGATGARATVFFPKGTYEVTTITIDKPNLTLDARDVRFEQGTGSGFNQMVYIKGAVDSGTAQYITIIGLTIDGNYPAVNNSGSGIGFNIRASNTYFQDVKAEYTEDATFVTAYCMNNTFDHCESKQAGRSAYRIRGDNQQILNCKAFNWNAVDATNGNRAILADGQEIDTENILVQNFYGEALESRQGMVAVLIDSGDGDDDGSNTLAMGNSGAATSVHGKASWLIDAGHGFAVGDGFKVQETGVTGSNGYDGASTTTGKSHKIIEVDGNTFIRSVDANTFSLYSTAAYAIAGGSTGRYDISSSGTGTFYVKSAGALKKQFTVASTVSDTYTCTAHGFTTGQMARLTVKSESGGDSLPTGLKNVARVTVNTDYNGAGTGGKYWREKRNKNVTFRDVTFAVSSPTAEDSAVMKVNNCHNLTIERMVVTQSPEVSGFAITSLLIGPGNRKVTLNECVLPNGVKQVVTSWLPEMEIHNCVIGDNAVYPAYAIDSLQVEHLTVKNTKLRFTAAGLATATAAEDLRFADIDVWDVQDNDFEGFSTSTTSRPRQIAINTTAHMNQSGKLHWFNNSRTATGSYQGLTVTTASNDTCTATNHTLMTGDTCYFTTIGALDGAITANTLYYVRRTGDNSFTIHTTPEGASDNTDRVNITGAGTGSAAGDGTGPHYLHGDHVNCNIANSNPLDRLFMHRDGSGKNFEGVTAPTSTSVLFNAGDIIWNMNPSTQADTDGSEPLAWICTKRGQSTGTPSPGTFRTLINDSQPNIGYFVVTDPAYGALGDDSTNDTTAVQAAVTAAAAYTAANSTATATVVLPKGIFRVAGAVGGGAIEVSGDRITIAGPGTLKLVSGDDADAVLYIKSGADYCSVQDITIDGNNAGSPSGRGDCLYMGGNYGMARNVKCQNSKASSGYDFLIIDDTVHNKLVNCTSTNAGYNAFDNRGDYTTVRDCQAIEFGRHGFNQAGGATIELTIDGLFATSSSTTATGVIIDPGSGNDNYVKQAVLRNVKVNLTGATNTLSVVKFARIHDLLIDGCYFTGTADTSTAKIVEACKKITIRDTYFSDNIDFDELGTGTAVTNSFSSVSSNGGFVQISGTAHGHKPRDVIYIVSSVSGYTGLFEVTSVPDANTFVIDCQWTTNTATGNWYDAQGAVVLEGVQIGEPSMARTTSPLSGLRTPRLTMRNCRFYGCRVRGIAAKNTYPITAIERYDIENCFFEFNRTGDSVTIEVLGGETFETDFFTSSRKVRWVNNSYRNLSTGTVKTFLSTDSQLFTTSLDGGKDYTLTSGSLPSGTAVTWQVGDRFFKPSPAAGASPGWVCTTAGTFSTGTFTVMPELEVVPTIIDDLSDVTITSFSSGETLRYNGSALVDSKLASTDLSDFASTIVGNSGDILGWSGTAWDDLTMAVAITNAFGNGTDNFVLTSDGAGGVAWEAATGITVDGTLTDGDTLAYDATDTVYVPSRPFQNVKNFIGGIRASGSSAQVTATATSGNASITTTDGTSWAEGYGAALVGGGSAHGISAPSNCFAIPRTVYQTAPLSAATVAPVTFTVDQTNDTILLPTAVDYRVALAVTEGQGLRLSSTGTLPTHSGGTLAEATTYYAHHLPQTTTVAMAGTPTGGTFRWYSYYQLRNQFFHVQEDPLLYVDLVYNAGVEVQTVAISGTPTGGTYTLTLSGYGTTGSIAYNGDETVVQAALRALTGLSRVVVTKTGSTPNYTFTVVFNGVNGDISQMTNTDSTTGGSHLITNATSSSGTATSPETALRTLPGCAQITIAQTGTSPNFTHAITWTGVPGRQDIIYDLAKLTGGAPYCTVTSTRSGGIQLYDTQANAIAAGSTGLFDLNGTGSSTNYVSVYGSKTYYFQASALSGNGGTTAAASEFTTTLGPHEADENQQVCIVFDKPTSAEGYVIYGDTSSGKKLLTACDQITNIRRVALNSSGFTSFEFGDIGKTFTDGSGSGTIECFDNTNRYVWISTSSTFPTNGATLTTTSGTGGGTQSGASTTAFMWVYNGKRFKREYNYYPSLARRGGEKIYPGQIMEYNGNLYTATDVQGNRRTAPEISFTINTSTDVLTLASATSAQTTAKPVYVRSSVSLPTISGGTILQENTIYYTRWASSTTCTLHPTSTDATNNTNKIDLTADNLGTYYMLDCPVFNTSLGQYTTDGWVTWRRQDQTYPTTPPSSAIADIFLATVVSVSSNTVVLSAGPTTSVTSQLLLHDDYPSVLAHSNACNSATAKSRMLYFPGGSNAEYQFVIKKNDSRMYNHSFGGGLQYSMFRVGVLSEEWIPVTWEAEPGTKLILASLDNSADLNDATDTNVTMLTFGRCSPTIRGIKFCHWAQGVPVAERPDAVNRYTTYTYDLDATSGGGANAGSRLDGPKFYNGGFYAFASAANDTWQSNEATADVFEDWQMYYGGSNHNLGVYVNGGNFLRCYFYGIRAERSQMFYQDAEEGLSLNLDHCYFEGSRKDGIAIRFNEARITNSKFVDCTKIFAREISKSLVIDNCDLYETDIIPNNTANAFDDIRISNLRMVDSELTTDTYSTNLNVNGVQLLITPHPRRYTTTTTAAQLKATDQNITDLTIDNRAWQLDYRSVNFGGNGSSHFTRVKVTRSKTGWCTFTTNGTGPKWWNECEFWTQSGGSTPCLIQHTGQSTWTKCKFTGLAGNPLSGNPYTFDAGGRSEFESCECIEHGLTFNSGITGPLFIRNGQFQAAVIIAKGGTTLEQNNFSAEPTLSGTLLATSRNKVADSLTKAVTLSASQNNYTWPTVCDTILVDSNASYSITGVVPRAKGTSIKIVNVDSADTLTISHNSGSSTAANTFNINAGADLALGPRDGQEFMSTENATNGWSQD